MNPLIALILGAVLGGVLASGGEPKKDVSLEDSKGRGKKKFHKIAPDFGSSTRHIRRCISGYVPVDVTP